MGAYYAGKEQWGKVLTANQVAALTEYTEKWRPEEEYFKLLEEGIQLFTISDSGYPERLKNIPDPPFGIFVRGKLPADDVPAVAVIGARECSEYGRYVARELGTVLGRYGVVVVSGMAKGIDGISQEGALEGGGISLGVLGSGVDVCYPAQNRQLYERLLKGGAVISEYPGGTPARPQNFPPRNRIVSGLADAVVVIEARVKSGTLITVDMALEQGREVYVVPGRVTDRLSDGCNRLIKQGAGVLLDPDSFYEELLELRESRREVKMKRRKCREISKDVGQTTSFSTGNTEATCTDEIEKSVSRLSEELKAVYQAMDFYPGTPEEIRARLPEKYSDIQIIPCLMQLCMEELAIQVSPGHFCRRGKKRSQ